MPENNPFSHADSGSAPHSPASSDGTKKAPPGSAAGHSSEVDETIVLKDQVEPAGQPTPVEMGKGDEPPDEQPAEETLSLNPERPNADSESASDETIVEPAAADSTAEPADAERDVDTLPPPDAEDTSDPPVPPGSEYDAAPTLIERSHGGAPHPESFDSTVIDSTPSDPNADTIDVPPPKSGDESQLDATVVLKDPGGTGAGKSAGGSWTSPTAAADVWSRQPAGSAIRRGGGSSADAPNRYRLIDDVAHGGMGKVWLAEDVRIKREVAYKELLPDILSSQEMVERFIEEAQVTGQLEHPGIVPIYDLGYDSEGAPYYAMKFVRGKTLKDAIKEYHALPADDGGRHLALARLLRNFIDVCQAMAYAHEHGVLHRDLKPANIMLGDFGETMVLDWGLAKLIDPEKLAPPTVPSAPWGTASARPAGDELTRTDHGASNSRTQNVSHSGTQTGVTVGSMSGTRNTTRHSIKTDVRSHGTETMAGSILGTPYYMSPEQAASKHEELDARSDIYALGAILYEILCGEKPIGKGTLRTMLKQIAEGRIQPPRQVLSSVPKPLEAICLKALALQPEDRYPSALLLVFDVEAYLADEPVSAWEEPWQVRLRRWSQKNRTLVASSTAAALMAALVFVAWWGIDSRRIAAGRSRIESKLADATRAIEAGEFALARRVLGEADGIADSDDDLFDMKPGIEAARQARLSRSQLKIEQSLSEARAAFRVQHDPDAAESAYSRAIALLNNEPALQDLLNDAERERDVVLQAIENRDAERAALAKFAAFQQEVDDARFYGSLFQGDAVDQDAAEAQKLATAALARYDLQGEHPLAVPPPYLSDEQREHVRDDGYEMLLLLARTDAILARMDGEEARQASARRSLGYVEQAERLGLQTRVGALMRASYLRTLGMPDDAQAVEIPNKKAFDFYLLADASRMKGNLAEAAKLYQQALQVDPDHFESLFLSGLCYLNMDNAAAAVSAYSSCIARRPGFVWPYVARGSAYASLGQIEAALADFDRATEIAPKLAAIFTTRGAMFADRSEFDKAISDFRQAISFRPDRSAGPYLLAKAYFFQGVEMDKTDGRAASLEKYQQSIDESNKALKLDGRNPKIYRVRAGAYLGTGNLDDAIADYQAATGLELEQNAQEKAKDHRQIAEIYRVHPQAFPNGLRDAKRECNSAIDLYADDPLAHQLLGEVLLALGEYAEAAEELTRALELGEPNAKIYQARSAAYAKLGRMRDSINDITRSLELDPQSPNMFTRRGWAYLMKGAELAAEDFQSAIDDEPKAPDSHLGLAYALVLQGKVEEAVASAGVGEDLATRTDAPAQIKWGLFYNAATVYAQAVLQVSKQAGLAEDVRRRRIEEYTGLAIDSLKTARKVAGPQYRKSFEQTVDADAALDPIRTNAEFKALFPSPN